MKKSNYTIAMSVVMTAAMAACSSQEELDINNGAGIEFRVAADKGSRAEETTTANLAKFSVTAINADGTTYFSDVYSRNDQSWIPVTQHYWPVDNSVLKFHAYSPEESSLTGTFTITNTEQKVTGFKPAEQLKDQQDFIVAYAAGKKSTEGPTGVQLTFKHALSQIEVRAKNAGAVYAYKVAGVRIGSVTSQADYALPAAAGSNGSWTLGTEKADYKVEYTSSPITLKAEPQSLMTEESGTAMLIPQQLTAWDNVNDKSNDNKGSFLGVYINIKIIDGENQVQYYPAVAAEGETQAEYGWACIPVDTKWEPGYKYVYTLDFSNGAGKYPPEDPDVPGEDVLTDPIRFTVDVEPWINDESGDHNLNM